MNEPSETPPRLQVGDFAIRVLNPTEVVPCGWTLVSEQQYGRICYKIVTATDLPLDILL